MNASYFKNKKNILRTVVWTLILIVMIFLSTTKQSYGLDGQCYKVNGNCTIKYVDCYCDCHKYKITDDGHCTRCWHRVDIVYPQIKLSDNTPVACCDHDVSSTTDLSLTNT